MIYCYSQNIYVFSYLFRVFVQQLTFFDECSYESYTQVNVFPVFVRFN